MRIVKKISDFTLSDGQKVFAEFIEQKIDTPSCSQKILNPDFLSEYIRPQNDFLIYTNAKPGTDAKRIIR